jgi:formamidopyrimidine-DNA glycosylase
LRSAVETVSSHPACRIFRAVPTKELCKKLSGALLLNSETHGKQMLFRFSSDIWLGLHLGMTGELRVEKPGFQPGKHDHLVLHQQHRALVFSDPRQFGRVRFHLGTKPPEWWSNLPAALTSSAFTPGRMKSFFDRHRRLSLKAVLLLQSGFPGLGNWMVDEILWRARLDPRTPAARVTSGESTRLWRVIRFVCRQAMKSVGRTYSGLPAGWLFHERWSATGRCPRDGRILVRETVGGRTTAWCGVCQPAKRAQ